MAQTIGQKLQQAREARALSIEDVARDTRIPADTIRGLETDNYSVFASPTYAKSFLEKYSDHLEVDAEQALNDFGTVAKQLSKSGRVCLAPSAGNVEPGESIHSHQAEVKRQTYQTHNKPQFPLFLAIGVFLLLLIIPTFYFIGKKADSMEEAATILKETLSQKEDDAKEPIQDYPLQPKKDKLTN